MQVVSLAKTSLRSGSEHRDFPAKEAGEESTVGTRLTQLGTQLSSELAALPVVCLLILSVQRFCLSAKQPGVLRRCSQLLRSFLATSDHRDLARTRRSGSGRLNPQMRE
ncbi:hypothetical protein A0H81_01285 [Grifola frondosa]|uniref:Uncharacterized protein n=1 Tax=Grifola frondosa TaxID=5627 RepID=A0A1C7MS19_GRIFR|nr:hypothetical protein A0H81_01285 [Grifola frondosa]